MKNFNLYILIAFFTLPFLCKISYAQDPHFSQHSLAPLFLNPALTGNMEGNHRLIVNYRDQWRNVLKQSAYKTIHASYDFRLCPGQDNWGIGIRVLGDQAGTYNFSRYQAEGMASYTKNVGNIGFLAIGAEVGMIHHRVDFSQLKFDAQFDGFDYDEDRPTNEAFTESSGSFFVMDISTGLLWYNNDKNLFIGLAVHHINTPNYAFHEIDIPLRSSIDMKITGHINSTIDIGRRFAFLPKLVFAKQGNYWQFIAGTDGKVLFDSHRKHNLHIGASVRFSGHQTNTILSDALIVSMRYDLPFTTLGFTYDFNISSLRNASNSQGAFEFSAIFILQEEANRNCVNCPFQ